MPPKLKKGDRIEVRIGLYLPPTRGLSPDTWVKATVVRTGRGEFKAKCDSPFDGLELTLIYEAGKPDGSFTQCYRPLGVLDRFAEET